MRHSRLWGIALLASAALFVIAGQQPYHIVRIEKSEAAWDAVARFEIDVAQELRTCFVARASTDDLRALRAAGAEARVLEWNARGKEFLLVRDPGGASLGTLTTKGRAFLLEGDVLLFRPYAPEGSRALPRRLARKPLPARSVLPFLKRPWHGPRAPAARALADPEVERILSEVSSGELRTTVQDLQDFVTRYASTAGCENAGTYLHEKLGGWGVSAEYQGFGFGGGLSSRNVIAEIPGRSYPEDILIICGHYDSTTRTTPEVRAPGADDNASGTAAVLEAARLLSRRPLDFTVRFVAFSAEEWGLYGSEAYAGMASAKNERIVGVVNLDMIAWAAAGDRRIDIYANTESSWLGERMARAASAYTALNPRSMVDPSMIWSDHSSFWDVGYPALLAIESGDNPHYHSEADTIDTLDFEFFLQTTRAALAVLTELAQPVRPGLPATPTGFDGRVVAFYSLFKAVKRVDLRWNAITGASGYNIYRSPESHLDYAKLNAAPVTATSFSDGYLKMEDAYFYVVRAVGAGGAEGNPSREFKVPAFTSSAAAAALPRFRLLSNGGRP
ncbi:MAG: M20/M25/M40 family metallo-hydrolase [Candidatus Aminicenantes bacterium]|nr:M20/M25/M40 family metallo-hydrolase [Candidatus Aminicenantes bacterium]